MRPTIYRKTVLLLNVIAQLLDSRLANLGSPFGFFFAGCGQVGVEPSAEPIVRIPYALAVSHQRHLVRRHVSHAGQRPSKRFSGNNGDFIHRMRSTTVPNVRAGKAKVKAERRPPASIVAVMCRPLANRNNSWLQHRLRSALATQQRIRAVGRGYRPVRIENELSTAVNIRSIRGGY